MHMKISDKSFWNFPNVHIMEIVKSVGYVYYYRDCVRHEKSDETET